MAEIKVTAASLKAKAESLRQTNAQFKTVISNLEATEGNLNGMWDGQAKDAFHNAFTSDKTQMTNFYNAIEKYASSLEQIAQKYAQAEAQNLDTAQKRTYK